MSSILVVEPEHRYVERINEALSGEGWKVRVVEGRDQALQAAASEAPDLVVVSTEVPGIELLTSSFSRNVGGPGVLALLSEDAGGQPTAGGVVADDLLAKPFSDQDLLAGVRRGLAASAAAAAARRSPSPQRASPEHKLTSQEIFADVLADLDEAPGIAPPPRAAAPPPPAPAAPLPPIAPVAPVANSAMSAGDKDIERRLDQTLSGLPGGDPRPRPAPPAPPAAPARRPAEAPGGVDALLSKTLGNLDLGSRPKPTPPAPAVARPAAPVQPAPPPSAPPARPAAPPVAAAPPLAPPQEGTAVRKAPTRTGDFDFSELEELARTGRRPAQGTAPGTAVRPPAPAAPVQTPAPIPRPAPAPPAVAAAPPPAAPRVEPPPPSTPIAPSPMAPMAPVTPVGARVNVADDPGATQRIPIFPRQETGNTGEHFGQYQLLERIAVGGMAEVWKARMRGVEGFQKMVAIKKILSHMTDNAEFIGMFIDEAKLAAQLNHPNIVHIYDLGKIGRDYYIAMEYVEGKDLRSLLNASRRKGMPLPMGLALLIAARLASALNYAHRKRDYEGKELGLVHRDVSPQNVLITPDGDVKLCDFGIAKAVSKAGQTQIGSLKGKLQYMSPEQAWGRQVDSRSDIFSLGAVLFEMLTAERLFPGDSEMSVLEAVRQVRTRRTREVVPAIPQDVDDIVARALASEPADRFQNAGEMEQRLDAVLAALIPAAPNHTDLSAYVRRVLAPQEDEDEIAIPELHFSSEPRTATPPPVPAPPAPTAPTAPPAQAAPQPQIPPAPQPLHVPQPPPVSPAQATAAPAPLPGAEAVSTPPPPHAMPVAEEPVVEPLEEPVVEPVAPVGEVLMEEEGPQKGRRLLYLIIGGLLLLAVLTFLWLANRSSAPGTEGPPAPAPGEAAPLASPAVLPAAEPAVPGATPAQAPVDITGIVDQQLAQLEQEKRKELEAQQKKLEKELEKAKAAGQPTPAATVPPVQPAPAAEPSPSPAATVVPQPEPPPVPEPATPTPQQAAAPPPEPSPEPERAPSPATGAAPVAEAGDVVPPQLVSSPKPQYPPVARRMRAEGTVVVSVLVDEQGQVQDARVTQPASQKVLNDEALKVARAARFRPATKNGVRVKMWTRLTIPFKL